MRTCLTIRRVRNLQIEGEGEEAAFEWYKLMLLPTYAASTINRTIQKVSARLLKGDFAPRKLPFNVQLCRFSKWPRNLTQSRHT